MKSDFQGLEYLDGQMQAVREAQATQLPELAEEVWNHLATTIYDEVRHLDGAAVDRLHTSTPISPERYLEELGAFQSWMDIAHANALDPAIVRAQVMTELYVAFVWLRDSLIKPIVAEIPNDSTLAVIGRFMDGGPQRFLRNAVAHGRWCYLYDFTGLEYWDGPSSGQQLRHFEIAGDDLRAWQVLSRGAAIAVLLALTERNN